MPTQELTIDYKAFTGSDDNFENLRTAVEKISTASKAQFEEIKKEKWYTRTFDLVTFSKKNEKRLSGQIESLAQAQQILMEIMVKLSEKDEKISEFTALSFEKIKRLSQNDIDIMNQLKRLEAKYLWGITKSHDLSKLEEFEKQVLSGSLFYLMEQMDSVSSHQREYANSLLNYLDVNAAVSKLEDSIGKVESIKSRKNILQSCMEYLFLNNMTITTIDEQKTFIDFFELGNRSLNELKNQVLKLYNLRGPQGFIDQYSIPMTYKVEDSFLIDFSTMTEEEDFDDLLEDATPIVKEDFIISSILKIDQNEVITIEHKNVHIRSFIDCKGSLVFDHCNIYYNASSLSDEISLGENASLQITNSKIECLGFDETFFIKGEYGNRIAISSSIFIDCSNFLNCNLVQLVTMEDSELINCGDNFIEVTLAENANFLMNRCYIEEKNIAAFNLNEYGMYNLIKVDNYNDSNAVFNECTILEKDSFKFYGTEDTDIDKNSVVYFKLINGTISNCSFTGASRCITTDGEILNCDFTNCEQIINNFGFLTRGTVKLIDNCTFTACSSICKLDEKSKLTSCRFIDCFGNLIQTTFSGGAEISLCEFTNIKESEMTWRDKASIEFDRGDHHSSENLIHLCMFNGVHLDKHYLIAPTTGRKKPEGTVVTVRDCSFSNCTTNRVDKEIINLHTKYDTIFKKDMSFDAVEIINCKGLESIK